MGIYPGDKRDLNIMASVETERYFRQIILEFELI